jgi:hypothetical protein
VHAVAAFIVRLASYAILLGAAARLAQWLWDRRGLDDVLVLAIVGIGALRPVAIFVAWFLVGAALTAPFAFARLAG